MGFPKIVYWKSKRYLKWISQKSCIACMQPGPVDPHHVSLMTNIVGGKPPDSHAVPLCRRCHGQLEDYYLGENMYWEDAGISIERIILRYITEYLMDNGVR